MIYIFSMAVKTFPGLEQSVSGIRSGCTCIWHWGTSDVHITAYTGAALMRFINMIPSILCKALKRCFLIHLKRDTKSLPNFNHCTVKDILADHTTITIVAQNYRHFNKTHWDLLAAYENPQNKMCPVSLLHSLLPLLLSGEHTRASPNQQQHPVHRQLFSGDIILIQITEPGLKITFLRCIPTLNTCKHRQSSLYTVVVNIISVIIDCWKWLQSKSWH